MPLFDEPAWWYGSDTAAMARVLAPLSAVWGYVATQRIRRTKPFKSKIPVICVGNFTAGGTGKTPFSLLLAREVKCHGGKPVFLTRGYGGRLRGPHWVTTPTDVAADVGDEPLLLVREAPTLLARDRVEGARTIAAARPDTSVIIMDDGLQNPALAKDLTFAVVDRRRGIGNGRVMPAGPLRAPLGLQIGLTDVIVLSGPTDRDEARAGLPNILADQFRGPVLSTTTVPVGAVDWLRGTRVLAYAGIGAPQRFFGLLEQLGADVVERKVFPDHHGLGADDARGLMRQAIENGLQLVTTEKDYVRLGGAGPEAFALQERSKVLAIEATVAPGDRELLDRLLADCISPSDDA